MEVKVILLDTDFAFEYFSGNESALAVINVYRSDFIALPSVVMAQIIRACRDKRDLAKAMKMVANIPILHINESITSTSFKGPGPFFYVNKGRFIDQRHPQWPLRVNFLKYYNN